VGPQSALGLGSLGWGGRRATRKPLAIGKGLGGKRAPHRKNARSLVVAPAPVEERKTISPAQRRAGAGVSNVYTRCLHPGEEGSSTNIEDRGDRCARARPHARRAAHQLNPSSRTDGVGERAGGAPISAIKTWPAGLAPRVFMCGSASPDACVPGLREVHSERVEVTRSCAVGEPETQRSLAVRTDDGRGPAGRLIRGWDANADSETLFDGHGSALTMR